ncbi:pyruvate kinase, partial [Streptococcus salivarius]|nr:pyruvate kinase [Streptococcus salivarius]
RKGDSVIVTAGKNVGKVGSTNLIQVVNVGEIVVKGQGIGRKCVTGEVARVEHLSDIDKIKEGSILVCSALENE